MTSINKREPVNQPHEPLTGKIPDEIKSDKVVVSIYKRLVKDLMKEGYVRQGDWRSVVLLARTEAYQDRVMAEIGKLKSLTVVNSNGGTSPHPLLGELRKTQTMLKDLYNSMFMTPKSRAQHKLSDKALGAVVGGQPEPDEMDLYMAGTNGEPNKKKTSKRSSKEEET